MPAMDSSPMVFSLRQLHPFYVLPCILLAFLAVFLYRIRCTPRPTKWPLVGMLPALLLNFHRLHDWASDVVLPMYGGNLLFRLAPVGSSSRFLVTCDPDNIRHVFTSNFANYPKGPEFAEIFSILGNGILTSDGDVWHSQRAKMKLIIARPRLLAFLSRCLGRKLEGGLLPVLHHLADSGGTVDLQVVLSRLSFDMTITLIFGADPGTLSVAMPVPAISHAWDVMLRALLMRHLVPPAIWWLQRRLGVGLESEYAAAERVLEDFVADCIAKMKQGRHDAGVKSDHLLSSYAGDTDKVLRDTAMDFLFAGRTTISAGLSWTFFLLAKNPDAEAKLLHELQTIVNGEAAFDTDELNKLVYLHAVIQESLRLYPPLPVEYKMAREADRLPSGHVVAPGDKIVVYIYSMGRMESVWGKDCRQFKPERWIAGDGSLRYVPSYRFMVFNTGPRSCVGKQVAMMQLKAVAAAVVWNFAVKLSPEHPVEPEVSIMLSMKKGLKVTLEKRLR